MNKKRRRERSAKPERASFYKLRKMSLSTKQTFQLCLQVGKRGCKGFIQENSALCAIVAGCFILLSIATNISLLTLIWFFMLGVSSSIGFGVGVPTRILFIVPYIMATMTGSFWSDFRTTFPILFVHAVGSSFGELPPFLSSALLAKHFSLDTGSSIIARMHQYITSKMQRHSFVCIIVLASWPNSTFDAAGLSAGAAGMSTGSFLTATIIGKACIRAPITNAVLLLSNKLPYLSEWLDKKARPRCRGSGPAS